MRIPRLLPALLAALALATGCEQAPRLAQGDPAPAFTLEDLDGQRRTFPDDFAGIPVVIRFWADWCRFCKQEMKDVEVVYRRFGEAELAILAVNVGQDRETARDFVGALGVTYDTLLDHDSAVAGRYGVVGLPTTYFVGRDGRVHAKILGEADRATFERVLGETL